MLIINADDFGFSASANAGIRECFRRGLINRTTMMVNMPHSDEAAESADRDGFMDNVGFHFNLTAGFPLVEACRRDVLLCRDDGAFSGIFNSGYYSRFIHLPAATRELIAEEFAAQCEKYLSYYHLQLKHLDSHHHIHTNRCVFQAIRPLVEKYAFKSIRLCPCVFPAHPFPSPKDIYKKIFSRAVMRLKIQNGPIRCSQYFCYLDSFRYLAESGSIPESLEVMLHPLYDGGKLYDHMFPTALNADFLNAHGITLSMNLHETMDGNCGLFL
ncbi:MAG: ChbG/HpnK family deacetylase [Victivallaceae bacterium]|nr:ChbG/HpnK family deacetylase [Victivallaceae bacterium]